MRTHRLLAAALTLAAAPPAAAQLSNRSIALESGISVPVAPGGAAHPAFALAAGTWLDGCAEGVFRVGWGAGAHPSVRAPAVSLAGTVGVRMSLGLDPIRPQLGLELGWARVVEPGRSADRFAFGIGAGLEWFPARDLSVAARVALRGARAALATDVTLGAAAYF